MDASFSEGWSVGVAKQQEKVCNSITKILLCCQYFTLTINIVLYHVMHIQQTIDKKGKGKIDPTDEIEYPYFLPTPSFDLWVASTPIISNLVNLPNMSTSKDVQQQVDVIITGVVIETGIEKKVDLAMKTINEEQAVLQIHLHTYFEWVTNMYHL